MLDALFGKKTPRLTLSNRAAVLIKELEDISAEVEAIPSSACDEEDRENIASIKMAIGIALVNLGLIVGTSDGEINRLGLTEAYTETLDVSTVSARSFRSLLNSAKAATNEV